MAPEPSQSGCSLAPADPLRAVFDEDVLSSMRSRPCPSEALTFRREVIESDTASCSEPHEQERVRWLCAQRSAWNDYLRAALECGLLQGASGNDLRARLTGLDDHNFRSAMAECMACWLFATRLHLPVSPRPSGRGAHKLELIVSTAVGDIYVEVKAPAPYVREEGDILFGDDARILARCLRDANKQFEKGHMNLLLLAPQLRTPVCMWRDQLLNAVLGHIVFTMVLNAQTGQRVRDLEAEFVPDGNFLRTNLPSGRRIKPNGMPAFTRISAVLCVEEWPAGEPLQPGPPRIEHKVLLLQNPHAENPITPELIGQCVYFDYRVGAWSDGRKPHT